MTTRGLVAVGTPERWVGLNNSADSYPTGLGEEVWLYGHQLVKNGGLKNLPSRMRHLSDRDQLRLPCPYCQKSDLSYPVLKPKFKDVAAPRPDPNYQRHYHVPIDPELYHSKEMTGFEWIFKEWLYILDPTIDALHIVVGCVSTEEEFSEVWWDKDGRQMETPYKYHLGCLYRTVPLNGRKPDFKEIEAEGRLVRKSLSTSLGLADCTHPVLAPITRMHHRRVYNPPSSLTPWELEGLRHPKQTTSQRLEAEILLKERGRSQRALRVIEKETAAEPITKEIPSRILHPGKPLQELTIVLRGNSLSMGGPQDVEGFRRANDAKWTLWAANGRSDSVFSASLPDSIPASISITESESPSLLLPLPCSSTVLPARQEILVFSASLANSIRNFPTVPDEALEYHREYGRFSFLGALIIEKKMWALLARPGGEAPCGFVEVSSFSKARQVAENPEVMTAGLTNLWPPFMAKLKSLAKSSLSL